MFNKLKEYIISLFKTRVIYFMAVFGVLFGMLIYRCFDLQIVHGDEYLNSFQLKIKKERTLDAPRGNIYDRNGELLAYNTLAYTVKIEDVFESGRNKNAKLNDTLLRTIDIIESNNDKITYNFNIYVDDYNNYAFSVSGISLSRFKADIFGYAYIDDMSFSESSASADEIIEYLTGPKRYNIDTDKLSKKTVIKLVALRYAMGLNAYQKYIPTTVAFNVCDKTVAAIYENSEILEGVSVVEDTIRVYPKGIYDSQIVGYTGKISSDELSSYSETDKSYNMNDIVGKTGIEKSMESVLRGTKGSETIYVDTLGRVIQSEDFSEPAAGRDIYLTIDSTLQEAVYHILEQKLAGILLKKITNTKEYIPAENASTSAITIPIYDVYYALFNNNVINISHLNDTMASDAELEIYESFQAKKAEVLNKLEAELLEKKTVYKKLSKEYKVYENYIEDILEDKDILKTNLISSTDETYQAWATEEVISLAEYIMYAISQNWIDTEALDLSGAYSESGEIYEKVVGLIIESLSHDNDFDLLVYKYLIKEDRLKPRTICQCLLDQGVVSISEEKSRQWEKKILTPYSFIIDCISELKLTPAQLALEPYSASMVITNVKNGEVLALVSYPSYDNNFLANGADADYLRKVTNDKSLPLFNYATQQRTAPGSTYKMVTATAGLVEGVITPNTLITCTGTFDETKDVHHCWAYPGRHGAINVTNAIRYSCNCFFYNVGYKLSLDERNLYNSGLGVDKLNEYATMYGLGDKSGVEIEEYSPILTSAYSVPSAIGQGTNAFTTVGLARYVTAVANSGTVFDLTLLDKCTDSEGNLIEDYSAEVRNTIELSDNYWDIIHEGMRRVVEDKYYFADMPIEFAGKTGTAQQSKVNADHGLFVCYAPFDDPEIAISVRIANGYSSEYVADTTKDVLKWYFKLEDSKEIVNGQAAEVSGHAGGGD
ncbi:MAG: penicillin-binding protein [Lachnospiraceae bacterium]|nr:penicillin-binding protein [Lachnospiraceae bacterium]